MHRRPESELLPLYIELERTPRNLKKVRIAKPIVMIEQSSIQNILVVAAKRPSRQRTMEDFWRQIIRD